MASIAVMVDTTKMEGVFILPQLSISNGMITVLLLAFQVQHMQWFFPVFSLFKLLLRTK